MTDYRQMLWHALSDDRKVIEVREPRPGSRHNKTTIFVTHRFEGKGFISRKERMQMMVMARNPLYDHLMSRLERKR